MTLSIVDENTINRTSTETWDDLGLNPGGDPREVWDADGSDQIEGFATDISVNHGTTVDFKINVNANPGEDIPYHIEIYRLGYYGGDGATLVHQSGPLTWQLRQTFYYPQGINSTLRPPTRGVEPIQYNDLAED